MKHSEVKGKTIEFTMTTVFGAQYIENIKAKIDNILRAGYYDIKNTLDIRGTNGGFIVKCDKLTKFFFDEGEKESFIDQLFKDGICESERDEKVNRLMCVFKNVKLFFPFTLPTAGKLDGDCFVTFRAGGDYLVEREGRNEKSYGPKLKADQFNNKGFYVEACDGSIMEYAIKG